MPQIVIEMDDRDFEQLTKDGLPWKGADWESKSDRFEPYGKAYSENPSWDWKVAYWVGASWSNVILARSFLKADGEDSEVVTDVAQHPNGELLGWLILTNYETERLKNR